MLLCQIMSFETVKMRAYSLIVTMVSLLVVSQAFELPCLEDGYVNAKLSNERYIEAAMDCMMDRAIPCPDKLASNVRDVAPEVLRGNCVRPCTPCIQKQVRKTIDFMQRNHSQRFGAMVNQMMSQRNRRPNRG